MNKRKYKRPVIKSIDQQYKKHSCPGLKTSGLQIIENWLHIPKLGANPPMPHFTQVKINFCPFCGAQPLIKKVVIKVYRMEDF